MRITGLIVAAALAAAPLASHALGTNEKGCLVGGAAGGVIGHAASDKALLGAAIGCGAGVLVNKQRVKKIDAKEREKKVAEQRARDRERARQLARRDDGVTTLR